MALNRTVELVMFDLDGTLADTVPQIAIAVKKTLEKNGLKFPGESRIRGFVGNGMGKLLQRSMTDKFDCLESDYDPLVFQQVRNDYIEIYMNEISKNFTLYEGVKDTLVALKKHDIKLAVVTNKPHIYIEPWIKAADLEGIFDYWIGGGVLPHKKPDPAVLIHVCKKLGVSHEHCMMVGDSSNDILAAKNAGIVSVGMTYGYNYEKPISMFNPNYVLEEFSKIKDLVMS